MKLSPLQLLDYFVAEFNFSLNSRFDAKKELDLRPDEITTNVTPTAAKEDVRQWTVALELKCQPAAETNAPYIFSITLVGAFKVADQYGDSKIEKLVRVNGASMLYGIAREIVREQTARGPDGPFILPSASFLPDEVKRQASTTASPAETPATQA